MRKKPWGGSTNFNLSMDMMLGEIIKAKDSSSGSSSKTPMLMVFTDMQFDQVSSWL
jgi:hypothetical protein